MFKQLYRFFSPKYQAIFLDYKVNMKPRYGHGLPPHQGLYDIINKERATYQELLTKALDYKEQLCAIKQAADESDEHLPIWNNGFLPGLDIVALYTLLATLKPRKYVEIGSGNSTKVAFKAKQEQQLQTQIISIDPMPRAEIDMLADQVIRLPFESASYQLLHELGENDILFVDNSHRILPNSDAMVFFMEILPQLKKGVVVQVHDVYLPYDYPQFMCDRSYSEQYGLAMYLMANPDKFQTLLPNYFISEDPALSAILQPIWKHSNLAGVEQHGGSYWLKINE